MIKFSQLNKQTLFGLGLSAFSLANFAWADQLLPFIDETITPTLNTVAQKDQSIYLNWNVPVDEEQIVLTESFDSVDLDLTQNIMSGVHLGTYNGHITDSYGQTRPTNDPVRRSLKIIKDAGIYGSKGIYATQTAPGNGWSYEYKSFLGPESNRSDESGFFFPDWEKIDTSKPLLLQLSAAGNGKFKLFLKAGWTGSSAAHESITYNENLSADQLKNRFWNRQRIEINNPKGIAYDDLLIATALDTSYSYNFMTIYASIEQQNGKWYLCPKSNLVAWNENARPGQTITPENDRQFNNVSVGSPLYYATQIEESETSIELDNEWGWNDHSFNLFAPTGQEVVDLGSLFHLGMAVETDSLLRLCGIKLIYAPQSRVYRDGQLIYEGKSSEFYDTDVVDTEAPYTPKVNVSLNGSTLDLSWKPVADKGTSYTYSTRLIYDNGFESPDSNVKSIEYASGVKEYRIYVNNTLRGTTDKTSYQLSNIKEGDIFTMGVVDWAGNETLVELRNPFDSEALGVPVINSLTSDPDSIQIKWDVDLPPQNIIATIDYENVELDLPKNLNRGVILERSGVYFDHNGNMRPSGDPVQQALKIISGKGYNQTKGILAQHISPSNGWDFDMNPGGTPIPPVGTSTIRLMETLSIQSGDHLAIRVFGKGNGRMTLKLVPQNTSKGETLTFTFDINSTQWEPYLLPVEQAVTDQTPYIVYQTFETTDSFQIDDIEILALPKSRLYRDQQVVTEDYVFHYDDEDVEDNLAPELPVVNPHIIDGKVALNWAPSKDLGPTYTYEVLCIDRLGRESARSLPHSLMFASGVKEYRIYVNDSLLTSTSSTSYAFTETLAKNDKVELGVVDHAGNEAKMTLTLPRTSFDLNAQAKPAENMIRLDWEALDEHAYQVFQKKEGNEHFQTIGTMDFNATTVRVLNVYPYISKKTISFTSWDGSSHSLPQSAILKQWMEEPNAEHSKGYGKGLITVDAVSISDFNNNPDHYLKNGTSEYQYDVIVFGISDSWGDSEPALDAAAELAVDRFLTTGRGVLFGHDTAYRMRSGTLSRVESFTRLAEKYLDVQLNDLPASELVLDNFYNGNNPSLTVSYTGTSTVEITKKGFLTNFPWSIGEVGTLLTTPYTHTAFQQTGKGDIWMRFNWENKGMNHPMNSYLYTHNNTALVQTGHSIANKSNSSTIATPDEQKVLANTLFYLKQLSSVNFLDDYSGQDVKAPNLPSVEETIGLDDGSILVTFNPFTDQGSTYDYYVKATHKNGNSSITSNTVTETITSGVAGVSYVVDTQPDTIPDNQLDTLSNYQVKLTPNSEKTTYLHIKAIDHAGNISETLHIPITTPPTLKSEVINNEYIRLDWTTPLLPENILWSSSFELNDTRPMINYFGNPGNQRLDSSTSFSGTSSLKIGDALKGKPNFFDNGKGVFVDVTQFDRVKKVFKNQMPVSIQLKGKASKPNTNAFITLLIAGGREFKLTDFGITATEFTPAGSTKIKINNPNSVNFNPPYDLIDLSNKDSYNWAGDLSTGINYIDINPLMHLTSGVTSDGYLHLRSPLTKDVQAGQSIKVRRWIDPIEEFKKPISSTEWETIQYNTTITDMTYLDMFTLGCFFNIKTFTEGQDIYLDDLSISTPVKVKLYRNNQLIYEGLDNHLDDINATDKTAPNPIDLKTIRWNVKATSNNTSQLNIQFNAPNDLGSNYTYQISSINSYGVESLKSKPVSETVTSGIKGYSYLIDRNPTSEPDNTIDLKPDQTQISFTGNGSHYLHIKVIDEAGNSSETQHIKLESLTLTAQAKPSENMIRLDWTDLSDNFYQVYQKKEGDSDFKTIGRSLEAVQVLNVYPKNGNQLSFTTWDNEQVTVYEGGLLKKWMEEPNSEHPKGYGQGLIEVTPVSFDDFNQNPSNYLKPNSDGSWNYDVVMVGSWDCNGWCGENSSSSSFSQKAQTIVDNYISDGYGFMIGHDFRSFADKVETEGIPAVEPVGSNLVKLSKKGILTNFPWNLGEVGTILNIPYTHNAGRYVEQSDIWIQFDKNNDPNHCSFGNTIWCRPDQFWWSSTNNHYLAIKNNVAMIQTGHSNGKATSDEQKILANTLFFLKQISDQNYLNDYSAQDFKVPEKPSVIKTNVLPSGFVELKFKDFEDNGSTYEYYVKATHKGGSSQISNTVTETITTGVAGVSYIVDTNPNTIPDNTIDTLNNQTLQIKPNTSQTTYLHVKTIDGAGNSSETLHYKLDSFTLTAQAKPSENNGKGMVRLDWTALQDHTYQVYQKKEGNSEFQSISMTDLSEMDPVKVLNIYPTYNIPDRDDNSLDIAGKVAKKSAILKDWIGTYGLGLIHIDSLNKEDFEANPDKWIKNPDGSYKYDVLAIGFWNIDLYEQYINSTGISAISKFIDDGGGVLVGHQHIGYRGLNLGLNTIKHQFGVKILQEIGGSEMSSGNIDYIIPEQSPGSDESYYWTMSTQVVAVKSGLLLNYPHQVSQEGRIFNIPLSHDTWEFYMGDVWLQYHNPTSHVHPVFTYPAKDINKLPDGSVGTTNGYIHTFNNTAIVQTGHTSVDGQLSATEDEGKLLANTLFYLKQLSSKNYLNDYSGQDLKSPNTPSINNRTYNQDNSISLSFDAIADQGSTYEYYVKATHKNGIGTSTSNIASATVTSGIKGYSWMADSNPDTIPDDIIEQTTNSSIKIPTNNNGPYYLHIKAIDKAGNVSETHHYELTDTSKPSLTLTQNPTTWTNGDVIITASASDSGTVASGVKEIILPDGNKVSGSTATFTAIQNGTYTFTAVDFMGNQQSASITISNIDKVKPTGSIVIDKNQDEFYDEETEIHINMSDILDGQEKLSGIAKAEIFDVNGTYTYTMTNPTQYTQTLPWVLAPYELPDGTLKAQVGMKLTDRAGNVTTVYSKEVTVIKVRVEEFHLTDVVNPAVYNKNNPFNRLSYPNIPSQELVLGGSFEFEAIYSYPPTATSSWTATYKATIYYIHPTEGTQSFPIELVRQSVDGTFKTRHTIPFSVKKGTQVYLDLGVKVFNTSGKLMGEDTFPDPAGTRLKIGEITGDIREQIQFNEIY